MTSSYRFTRQQRLLKASEFKYVFIQPVKSADPYFTVLARANALTFARLGLAIGKKQVKLAVVRNRLKRLIRESFRLHQWHLVGLDCVVLARYGVVGINNQTLLQSLAGHWQRLSRQCQIT